MTYQGSLTQLKEVERLVHDRTAYEFLKENFDGPKMDQDQMLWLHESLRSSELAETDKYRVITATLYVILAHDTHEGIDEEGDAHKLTLKERELTVLAGDYYSALYYRTMAELGMIDLLRALQRGVQKMNTAKTNIYQLHVSSDEQYASEFRAASAAIFSEFARYFGKADAFVLLAEHVLALKKLLDERTFYELYHSSTLKRAYEHGFFARDAAASFEEWLEQLILRFKQEITELRKTCEPLSSALDMRLQEMLQR
ncbi:heptaprenyl diphosphate synthase component 1 [Listeria aquatica]|uniref:Heptaprenyl diphosphate synthase component 1 n=1 Tax=Listeria aquatica TaxID=1494960 RepID=A0A841ZIH3_9LIST|nr:heptaprenyl diphosphate synthase component 1 [Listeria aquatica]MBC1520519.1 heptaprenyl diphosphate synthase component 1 [Listeria aquatica]